MKKRVSVVTGDVYLSRKIYLILKDEAELSLDGGATGNIALIDLDTAGSTDVPTEVRRISMSRRSECDLPIPFTPAQLIAAVKGVSERIARLSLTGRTAWLDGKEIRLTEVEATLLSRLIAEGGDFVSRERLLTDVWGDGAEGSVINVYIHYLREKLERQGEKIILSSRSRGYKIDGKYLWEGEADA